MPILYTDAQEHEPNRFDRSILSLPQQPVGHQARQVGRRVRNLTNAPAEYAIAEARELLQNISINATAVSSLGKEHRMGSLWNIIPILSNIRSHLVAGKEADAIAELKEDMRQLESIVDQYNVRVDLRSIRKAVAKLQEPGGISKWVASILPLLRWVHRQATPQRAENVHMGARKVRRQEGFRQAA